MLEDLNLLTFSFKFTSHRVFHAAHLHVMLAGASEVADRAQTKNQIVENQHHIVNEREADEEKCCG